MAKPLSEKSRIIRDALKKHPGMGNTELATFLNDSADRLDDKLEFKAGDVSQQKIALKKAAKAARPEARVDDPEPTPKKRGRRPGRKPGRKPTAPSLNGTATAIPKPVSAADLLDRVFALAEECGGIGQLKRIVERLAAR